MKLHTHTAAIVLPSVLLLSNPLAVFGQTEANESGKPVEKIVVVGTQTDLESARRELAVTPGGTDLLDIDEFRARNVSSLADVLRYVAGVWSSSDSGSDAVFFSSRGSNLDATDYDMNGIKLLKDGLPITTADGNNHNRVIDPLSARHATIARGANAMKYGAADRRLDVGFSIEEQALFRPIVDQVLVDFDGAGPAPPVEVFSLLIDTDHRNTGAVLRYNHRVGDHDFLIGVNYGESPEEGGNYRNLGGTPNGLTTRVDNDATLMEAFAMDRWSLNDRLMLILAAQTVSADRRVRNVDVETGFSPKSGRPLFESQPAHRRALRFREGPRSLRQRQPAV